MAPAAVAGGKSFDLLFDSGCQMGALDSLVSLIRTGAPETLQERWSLETPGRKVGHGQGRKRDELCVCVCMSCE